MAVDVHVIETAGWEKNMELQLQKLPSNCVRHVAPFCPGDSLTARINAFAMGTAEFVSYIDPDDEVLVPEYFTAAEQFLRMNPHVSAVYSRYVYTSPQQTITTPQHMWFPDIHLHTWGIPPVHQIIVSRRKHTEHILANINRAEFPNRKYVEMCINASYMKYGPLKAHNTVAYNWITRETSESKNHYPSDKLVADKYIKQLVKEYINR